MDEHTMRDVVISGVGGLFPGSGNLEQLGRCVLANEYLVQRHEDLWNKDQRINLEPVAGRMPHHDRFDNTFFGMHHKLSLWSDPMAKLGYERCFEALLDAGVNPASVRGSNAQVYVGTHFSDHEVGSLPFMDKSDGYTIMGHSRAMNSNRVSYYFDFSGLSCTYDAAEAFGQLGLRKAGEAVGRGECDAALVVASTAISFPNLCQMYKDMGILSADMQCHPYDEAAHGTHRSECCVAFLLQPAELAKRSYARLVASDAVHLGRRLRFDPTLPNPAGIRSFLDDMYRKSGVDPGRVAYVEGDGTGHHLLDALELDAVDAVLGARRPAGDPLLVGSIKSNLGHTEVASGMVGVAKCIVAMERGVIPATINHVEDNTLAGGLAAGRLKIVTDNTPLEVGADTYMAVNSQSLTGLFGHTILQANPRSKRLPSDASAELPRLVVVSGRSEESTLRVAEKVKSCAFDPEYLRLVQDTFGPSIRGYEYRSYVICPPLPNEAVKVSRVEKRTVWFVYSGMGSQWAGMGAALLALPVFAATIDRLHAVLLPKALDLKAILTETGPTAFDSIIKSFVGITACQVALTNVLTAMGLKPDGIIGHSVGELGCAYADGCLTEEQAILAAWARGRASMEATLVKGMMAAVGLGYRDLVHRLPPSVEVACRNSASSCTLSGPAEDVKHFVKQLTDEGVFARAVNVSDIAYHSQYIQPAAPFLRKYLEEVIPHPKRRSSKWISTSVPEHLSNTPAAQWCSAEYQTNNLLSPVLFEEGLAFVPQQASLVEVAPHGLLQAILKRALPSNAHVPLTQRDHPDPLRFLLHNLGSLTFQGVDLDVAKLYPEVSFPVSRGTPSLASLATWNHEDVHYFGFKFRAVREGVASIEMFPDSPSMSVAGTKVVAPTECLETVWTALGLFLNAKIDSIPVTFEDIMVANNQPLPDDGSVVVVARTCKGSGLFEVEGGGETLLMSGRIRVQAADAQPPPQPPAPPAPSAEAVTLTGQDVLSDLAARGVAFTDKYRALKSVQIVSDHEWLLRVDTTSHWSAVMEALLQALEYRASEEALGLVLLRRWQRLDLDPVRLRASKEVVVRYLTQVGELHADGLFAAGFSGAKVDAHSLQRGPQAEGSRTPAPPLSFQFVPYGNTKMQSVTEFLSLVVQLAVEGLDASKQTKHSVTIIELQNCSGPNVLGPAVRAAIAERLGVTAEVRTVSVGPDRRFALPALPEQPGAGALLTVSAPTTLPEAVRVTALVGGLLLTRSTARVTEPQLDGGAVAVVAEQRVDGDWVTLLRRPEPVDAARARVHAMPVDGQPHARLPEAGPGRPIVLVWRGQPAAGVPAVVEEVRRRPYAPHARLVFILDADAPAFSLSEPLYAEQLRLGLQVNVLHRGAWGCWRALPLAGLAPAALSATSLEGVAIDAYGLNPRDRADAPEAQGWSGHLDYVGQSTKGGGRVMGVARWLADSARPRRDPLLQWAVPEAWSAAEAATVPYTYATVYHALLVAAGLRRGESILVHEGASAVGQAALRVAFQQGCATVFTTVASEEQRLAVLSLFPQMVPAHVLRAGPGDTSFEWHVRTLTHGRGVDVVLGALPRAQFRASLRCVSAWGRMLHLGREDMLAANTFGLHIFLSSVVVQGLSGDQLFLAGERDRHLVRDAVEKGLANGVVQPIVGAKVFTAPSVATLKDALWSGVDSRGEHRDAAKVVMTVHRNGVKRHDECSPKMSYVIVGGHQHEWLQVAGWLAQHGAREIVAAADCSMGSPSLLRHRQRALRRQFAANLRVEDVRVRSWDEAAALRLLRTAAAVAPIDAVVVLTKDETRAPSLLHGALEVLEAGNAGSGVALVVLSESAEAACALSALCEARRAAGQRAACLAGPVGAATDHLADLLSGARPAVTILAASAPGVAKQTAGSAGKSVGGAPPPCGMPRTVQALAEVGRGLVGLRGEGGQQGCRVRELPTLGLRHRHSREALPVFAVPALGALDNEGRDALAALALRVANPLLVVHSPPRAGPAGLDEQAASAAAAIVACRPHGPYNVLGWGLGTPLAHQVGRHLEAAGHNAVTFLVDGDVTRVRDWASDQVGHGELSLLRAVFADEQSQEVLEREAKARPEAVPDPNPLSALLSALPVDQRPPAGLAEAGLAALRTAVAAVASHSPCSGEPASGRLIDIQPPQLTNGCSSFRRSQRVSLRTIPRTEAELGLRSAWLARVLMENSGWSKEAKEAELRSLLIALEA